MTGWELSWERYPKYDDIIVDEKIQTHFVFFEGRDEMDELFKQFKDGLAGQGCNIEVKHKEDREPSLFQISHRKKRIDILTENHFGNCIIIRSGKSRTSSAPGYLKKFYSYDDDIANFLFVVRIEHGIKTTKLEKGKSLTLSVIAKTGVIKELEESGDLLPYTFYLLKHNDTVVGQALVKYYHDLYDVTECGPTILMFEIQSFLQDKGFGSMLLEFIEKEACDRGFPKIFLSDVHSHYFWFKHDYDIDIDEGEKEMECW